MRSSAEVRQKPSENDHNLSPHGGRYISVNTLNAELRQDRSGGCKESGQKGPSEPSHRLESIMKSLALIENCQRAIPRSAPGNCDLCLEK